MAFRSFLKQLCLLACLGLCAAGAQAGIGLPERLVLLSERIAAAPTDQGLYLRRALIYIDTGEFKLALADIDAAAQFGPVANTTFTRAILLHRLGQFAQALPLLGQFIAANPTHTEALMYRARVLRDAGQREQALADYRSSFRLQPNAEPGDTLTAARLIVELADAKRRGYRRSDALALLDARIATLGNAPQLQRYAIEIEQQACRSAEVLARLEQLHADARRAPLWHLQKAEQQLIRGEADAARAAVDAASVLLDARRPTAEKSALVQHRDFLRALLALPDAQRGRSQAIDTLYRQFYPTAAPKKKQGSEKAADESAHQHATLAGFEQPHATASANANASVYDPAWAESLRPFTRCLRRPKPARQ